MPEYSKNTFVLIFTDRFSRFDSYLTTLFRSQASHRWDLEDDVAGADSSQRSCSDGSNERTMDSGVVKEIQSDDGMTTEDPDTIGEMKSGV